MAFCAQFDDATDMPATITTRSPLTSLAALALAALDRKSVV
jgi:hypothetical protein